MQKSRQDNRVNFTLFCPAMVIHSLFNMDDMSGKPLRTCRAKPRRTGADYR